MRWQLCQLLRNLIQAQADSLRKHDERDAPQYLSREAPLRVSFALGSYQAALLVKPER